MFCSRFKITRLRGFGFDSQPGIIGVSPMTSFGTDGSGSLAAEDL